jgi:endonuclease/exonuclease/phosphatase family metal-dependent hydrolase
VSKQQRHLGDEQACMSARRRRLIATLAIGLLFALPLAARAEEPRRTTIEVASLNIWGLPWTARLDARVRTLGAELVALKPDVVCLQEVWRGEDGKALLAALAAGGLPHGKHWSDGLVGSGLLIASRFPLEEMGFHVFTQAGKAWKPWHGDWYARKGVALVELATKAGPVRLAVTHLHARRGSDEYLPIQITQALEAAKAVGDVGARPTNDPSRPPLVFAGDINSRRDALPFRLLVAGAALEAPRDDLRVDWVFARDGASVEAELERVKPILDQPVDLGDGQPAVALSNHPGRLATIELRPLGSRAPTPSPALAWESVAPEAREVVTRERDAALGRARWTRGAALTLLLASATLFWVARKKGRWRGCLLVLAAVGLVSLATLFSWMGAVHEPSLAPALDAAREALGPAPAR